MNWHGWVNLIAGFWAVLSGLTFPLITPVNFALTGIVVGAAGFSNAKRIQGVGNGLLGLWLFFSAFWPALVTPGNLIVTGLLIAAIAASSLVRKRRVPQTRPAI